MTRGRPDPVILFDPHLRLESFAKLVVACAAGSALTALAAVAVLGALGRAPAPSPQARLAQAYAAAASACRDIGPLPVLRGAVAAEEVAR